MKKCKKCGAILEDDANTCIFCQGNKFVEVNEDETDNEAFGEDKGQNKKDTLKKIGAGVLAAAAFFALIFTVFVGQTVRYVGKTRSVDPMAFTYFTNKNMLDYLAVAGESEIAVRLLNSGLYVTNELVAAYRAISVTQTVVAIAMIICVCGFFALAVYETVCNIKGKFKKMRILGYVGTVVSYVCGVFVMQTIESGKISVIYKTKNSVVDSFMLSYGPNTATIIGLILVILALFGGLVLLMASNGFYAESREKTAKREKEKQGKNYLFSERITACVVAACALASMYFASSSAVASTNKGVTAVIYKNEATGVYEKTNFNTENGNDLTLIALVQKYSMDEEEILYGIDICEAKIKENDQDLDSKIQLESLKTQLNSTRTLMQDALNFGLTTVYVNIALIVFAGVLICFVICGRRIQKGDLLVGVSIAVALFAFLGFLVSLFVTVSFAQLGVRVFNASPIFHLLFSVGALVATFWTRKFTQSNLLESQGAQKDVLA